MTRTLDGSPTVRLAYNIILGVKDIGDKAWGPGMSDRPRTPPAILVSFYYLQSFMANRHRYHFRDWVMDSGAFSAFNSGVTIDLQAYIETCLQLLQEDPDLTEVFSLDVIGDWKGTLKNTEKMWEAGVPAIPTFHGGSPWDALKVMARDYPKIALGGVALAKGGRKLGWARQCFSRVWPKRIHGFGFGSYKALISLPWHSVDSTNWEAGPARFGNWAAFGQLPVRGSAHNLRAEVELHLRWEREARMRWRKEMAQLDALPDAPTVRLAAVMPNEKDPRRARYDKALPLKETGKQ